MKDGSLPQPGIDRYPYAVFPGGGGGPRPPGPREPSARRSGAPEPFDPVEFGP